MSRLNQQLIRENCEAGWQEGQRAVVGMPADERRAMETDIAERLRDINGLDHNYHQGMWYAVSQTPLSIVWREIEEDTRPLNNEAKRR